MEILTTEHENIRTLASRELHRFGIRLKLKKLPSKKKPTRKKRCYAVALNHLETVDVNIGDNAVPIPKIINDLVSFIKEDLREEYIFRKEGSKVKERTLVRILDSGYQIPDDTNVIEACVVTKIFLRNIPGRLIPKDMAPWFLEAGKLDTNSGEALGLCVLLLPLENLYLLVFLMQFFYEVTTESSHNKMTPYNLAVVIAPNIFVPISNVGIQAQGEMSNLLINITKTLIERSKTLGTVPSALINRLEELHEEKTHKNRFCTWYVHLKGYSFFYYYTQLIMYLLKK